MFATLLLQGSLLVAPMQMGDAPPETRAVAALRFADPNSNDWAQRAAKEFRESLPKGSDLIEAARMHARLGSPRTTGIVGTFPRGMLFPAIDRFLDTATSSEVSEPLGDGSEWFLVQLLDRDAACRQIFFAGTDEAAYRKYDETLRELAEGAGFAELARARSEDRASALRDGALAIYERGPDDTLLREAAFNCKVGELIHPITSPMGLHILMRVPFEQLDPRLRDDTWARARAILIAFGGALAADPALERAHADAECIANDFAARIRRGEDMAALAAELNDDRGGRERGGDLGWVRRATTRMPPFFDRLFLEPPGTLIGPIATKAGYVLLRREDPGPRSRIDLRKNAFVDLEQWVRKLAESRDETPSAEGLDSAVQAARAIDNSFGSPLEWGAIEGHLVHSMNAADFLKHCESLPESVNSLGGRPVALRSLAVSFASSLATVESTLPLHERTSDSATVALKQQLVPLGDVALDELMRALGMSDPRVVIPVYLVAEGPRPGGVTHRARDGAVCLIDADENTGSQLLEVVLHETSHALDVATSEQPGAVLDELRKLLADAGLDRRDRLMRDIPHTLMFVTSAWVVRRVFDSAHEDYGDVSGYYAKVQAATDAVRVPWTEHLDGQRTRAEALQAIVDAAVAKK